jgi:hypothetical protein
MPEINLQLGAKINTLSQHELKSTLDQRDARMRSEAIGFKIMDFPVMRGTITAGAISLGGDQPDQTLVGPKQGFVWAVHRISILNLTGTDTLQLYKGSNRFICNITATTAMQTFSKGQLSLMPGDFLRVVGSSLSGTGQITVYSEGFNVPAQMIVKLS